MELLNIGKMLLINGGVIAFSGLLLILINKTGFIGRLPGDIFMQKGNLAFYLPLVSFLILSLVLTVVVNIILRFLR